MLFQDSFLGHKSMQDTSDELDETLSLSDLPLYGDQSVEEWEEEDLSTESQGSTSMSSSDNDYFEFFSHELTPGGNFPPENIIFCGKILPYVKPESSSTMPPKEIHTKQPTGLKKKPGLSMFRWSNNKSTTTMQKKDNHQTTKKHKGLALPLNKMSILTSSSSGKARWYLFLTGISRFSSRMELRDIKSRQSRRHNHCPPPSPALREDKMAGGGGSRSSSRLWEVVRVLSCGGNHHPNAMVVGSITCNRLE